MSLQIAMPRAVPRAAVCPNRPSPPRIEHLEPIRLSFKELSPHLIGIEAARGRDLVEKALDREHVLIRARCAPVPDRQVRVLDQRFDAGVRHLVAVVSQSRDGLRLGALGRRISAGSPRIDEVTTRIDHAVGSSRQAGRGLESDNSMRAEFVLARIFLAGPHQFYGLPARLLGDCNRLNDLIARVTPSEAAADETVVHINLLRLETEALAAASVASSAAWSSDPDVETVGLQVHRRVHRLHRRMRKIGCL